MAQWAGGEDVPHCNESTVQAPPSVDSSSCAPPAASRYETMTASSDKEYGLYARGYYGSPADSVAAINIGESGTTSEMHITVSGPAPTSRSSTGWEDIEEIHLYGSAVTLSYYGWDGPRCHGNTGTWSRRAQGVRPATRQPPGLRFRVYRRSRGSPRRRLPLQLRRDAD